MNMLETLSQAQGGNALANLGQRFGLDQGQTEQAVRQLLPAISSGLKHNTNGSDGLRDLLGALQGGNHERYLEDPKAITEPAATEEGNGILGHIFGSKDVSRTVADHASATTGIGSEILKQMLPVVAAMVMGSLAKNTRGAGLESIIGSVLGGGGRYRTNDLGQGLGSLGGATPGSGSDRGDVSGTSVLGAMLDADGDGSVADDILRLAGRLMR